MLGITKDKLKPLVKPHLTNLKTSIVPLVSPTFVHMPALFLCLETKLYNIIMQCFKYAPTTNERRLQIPSKKFATIFPKLN